MADKPVQTQKFNDEIIQRDVVDLMHGWRDAGIWLCDDLYQVKRDAAERLIQVDSEYLYPFLGYLGISGDDYEQALKRVKKYSRVGRGKRFWFGICRILQNLFAPF